MQNCTVPVVRGCGEAGDFDCPCYVSEFTLPQTQKGMQFTPLRAITPCCLQIQVDISVSVYTQLTFLKVFLVTTKVRQLINFPMKAYILKHKHEVRGGFLYARIGVMCSSKANGIVMPEQERIQPGWQDG